MATRSVSSSRFLILPTSVKSLSFNGSTDKATVPVELSATNFNVSFWFKLESLKLNQEFFSYTTGDYSSLNLTGLQIKPNNESLGRELNASVWLNNSTIGSGGTGKKTILSKWDNVTVTYALNSLKVYVNSVLAITDTSVTFPTFTQVINLMHSVSNDPTVFTKGKMCNLTIHNDTPWSQSQIDDLYLRNKIPSGAIQWSMNNTNLDQNGSNGLTLTGTSYSTDVPPHMTARSSATRLVIGKAYRDSFNRANGALGTMDSGDTWNHTGWVVASSKANSAPTPLTTLVSNGSFTSNTTGWTAVNATLASVAGGSSGNCLQVTNVGANLGYAYQAVTTVVNTWYKVEVQSKNGTTTGIYMVGTTIGGTEYMNKSTNSAGWTGRSAYFRATTTTTYVALKTGVATDTLTALYDEITLQPLTLSELMATVQTTEKDVVISCNPNQVQTGGMGIIASVDSYSNPQNFVLIEFINGFGGTARMTKCVNGTYTQLFSTSISTSSGRTMTLVKKGTSYSFYYQGNQVGTTQTITDSSIISNTLHGMFSPDTQSTVDNFIIGTGVRSAV